jgi:hypothetical protein
MVDALSLIHPTDKWYIYNFHTPKLMTLPLKGGLAPMNGISAFRSTFSCKKKQENVL